MFKRMFMYFGESCRKYTQLFEIRLFVFLIRRQVGKRQLINLTLKRHASILHCLQSNKFISLRSIHIRCDTGFSRNTAVS
jgi:hypothetical protein